VHALEGIMRDLLRARGIDSRSQHVEVFRAVRFQRGELLIEVDSAAHFQELQSFTGESYRQRANEHLPQPAIDRVVFKLKR